MKTKIRDALRRVFGTLCLAVLSLLVAEGALQIAARSSRAVGVLVRPPATMTHSLPDSLLMHRGNPAWPDHDAKGFRNAETVAKTDFVLLGDSQTYGTSVAATDAWPSLLSTRTGAAAYNMAFGGWGPGQGLLLLPEALKLRPSSIIYAFYFGNDLPDVFNLALRRPEVERFLPRALMDSSRELDRRDPLGARLSFLFAQGDTVQAREARSMRDLLSDNSMLYGLARALRRAVRGADVRMPATLLPSMDAALGHMTPQQRQFVYVFRGTEWRTLLTPQYRALTLDLADPRIKAAVAGTKEMLVAMDSICRSRGVTFSVLLIPTKERVFSTRFADSSFSPDVAKLVANEARIQRDIASWLEQHRVQYLDALTPLANASRQPYFENADGHPNEVGHQIVADLVRSQIPGRRAGTAALRQR